MQPLTVSESSEIVLDGNRYLLEIGDKLIVEEIDLRGEWWLDDSGQATFADGDIGDYNHIMVAFESALGVNLEDSDTPEMIPLEPLSNEAIAWLRENDTDTKALEYLKDGSDPRDYAMEVMGWIRILDNQFQMMNFDRNALDNISGFLYEEYGDTGVDLKECDDEIIIEEMSTNKMYSLPIKLVVMGGASAEGLKAYADRRRGT